tara:strand:+ start:379 stop:1296 length:918 start_codon:yes stop_codon:yes gene_type:complete
MKLSINTSIISKIDKDLLKDIESQPCWQSVDIAPEEAFELIATHGIASTCELRNNARREANYVSRQLFMIDMDDGMTIPELLADPFYNAYGAGFYATSSFTPELHKFRIVFVTEQAIDSARLSRLIIQGLRLIYPQSDAACVDPARLFYGNAACILKEYTGRVLPDEVIAALVTEVMDKQEQREAIAIRPLEDFKTKTAEDVIELLRELKRWTPDLSYAPRRDVTWAVAASLGPAETVSIMRNLWPDGNKTVEYEQFIHDHKRVAITLGTIYHMIRQHDPTYGRALRQLTLDQLKNKLQQTKEQK